ncbi:MAG TPA: reverse transcriptase domain-containing protein [Blastocatellia bacterium]|nr:reverse transcriptase domain-containing protein [Blastocatellia bacterium]
MKRRDLVSQVRQVQKQLRRTPFYDREKRHPCKVKYVRYADDFVALIAGNRKETEAIRDRLSLKLSEMGLTLSEEKTKLTHWSRPVSFLGYRIKGKRRTKGVGIRAVLIIPPEKIRRITESIEEVCSYRHIPEADAMVEVSAMFRGWCNYYRYANSPQPCFSRVARKTWWAYAHYLVRKTKTSSIRKLIVREETAGRLVTETKNGRRRLTFRIQAGKRFLTLDIFPPKTGRIISIRPVQDWQADLKPFTPLSWQGGRSFATPLEARDRSNGICERCHTNPAQYVHHTVPIRGRSILARIMSDRSQRYTAQALCQECHLKAHGGSFRKGQSNRNAGYAERCSPSVGSAGQKPAFERE